MSEDILGYLKSKAYGQEQIDHVGAVFDKLDLPLPQDGEFYKTEDLGALVLLSRYALALRFTTCAHPAFTHTHVLQPLVTFEDDILRAELFPGVQTPYMGRDYTNWMPVFLAMEKRLAENGIEVTDVNSQNGAILPAPHESHHVFIDPGALRVLSGRIREVREVLKKSKTLDKDDPQTKAFGGLKALFQKAVANDNHEVLNMAFARCKDMKERGLLVANWENVDYGGTQAAAVLYEAKLQAIRPALP